MPIIHHDSLLIEYISSLLSIACCTRVYTLQCILSLAFSVFVQLSVLVAAGRQVQTVTSWDPGEQSVDAVSGLKIQDHGINHFQDDAFID